MRTLPRWPTTKRSREKSAIEITGLSKPSAWRYEKRVAANTLKSGNRTATRDFFPSRKTDLKSVPAKSGVWVRIPSSAPPLKRTKSLSICQLFAKRLTNAQTSFLDFYSSASTIQVAEAQVESPGVSHEPARQQTVPSARRAHAARLITPRRGR
jgi:hypothetical protein